MHKDDYIKPFGNGGSTPSQYSIPEGAKDLQDLIEDRNMNFAIGNIFKACYRLGMKNKPEYDINKIIWFATRELQRIRKDNREFIPLHETVKKLDK